MSTPLAPDALMAVVLGLRRVVRRRLRADLAEPPLRGAQVELLQLVEADPGIGVAAAARALHLAGNTVSTLVNQLTAAGLLHRTTDPDDRRAVRLELTDVTRARLARWRAARSELVAAALAELTAEQAATIADALPALTHLLDVLAAAPDPDLPDPDVPDAVGAR